MALTNEKIVDEAVKRMAALHLSPIALSAIREGRVFISEGSDMLYSPQLGEEAIIHAFEAEHNAFVYHVIHGRYYIGDDLMDMYAMLYVSAEEDEWEFDRDDIAEKCPLAYVYNLTYPELSEFGGILVETTKNGTLRRIG